MHQWFHSALLLIRLWISVICFTFAVLLLRSVQFHSWYSLFICFRLKNSDDSGEDEVGKDLQSVEKEPLVSFILHNIDIIVPIVHFYPFAPYCYFFLLQPPLVIPNSDHKLQCAYWLWFSRRSPGKQASLQSYDQNLKLIGRFGSVEQFWALYSHLVHPSELQSHSDFHLFKVGIKPMWEVRESILEDYSNTEQNLVL